MASAETEVARVASGGRLGAVATRAAAAMAKEAGCSARIRSLCNLCQARSGTAVIAGAVDGEAQIADACVGANAARYVRCGWCMRRYSHAQTGSRGHVARCSWRVQTRCTMQRQTIAQLHEYRYASQAIHGQQDGAVCRRPPQRVDRLLAIDRLQRTCSTRISCPRAIASSGSEG